MPENKDVKPWDFFRPGVLIANKKVVEERLLICSSCPSYRKIIKQCTECLCIMPSKARLAEASCPLGKWLPTKDISPGVQ